MSSPAEHTVGRYRTRLTAMRDRLAKSIDTEIDHAREAVEGPGEDQILHTHNADMDSEGVDAAVGTAAGLRDEHRQVELALSDLEKKNDADALPDDGPRPLRRPAEHPGLRRKTGQDRRGKRLRIY